MLTTKRTWLALLTAFIAIVTANLAVAETKTPAQSELAQYEAALDQIIAKLQQRGVRGSDISTAFSVAKRLESVDLKLAATAYQRFAKVFAASGNPRFAQVAAGMEGTARRITLVGNPLELPGAKMLDGKAFELSKYEGKVIVIDFWATWCGDCIRELPGLEAAYAKYKDQGLEVVGLSIDEQRSALDAFLARRALPWPMIFDAGGAKLAAYYGINEIPASILVDRNGKVLWTGPTGPALMRQLEVVFD